MCLVSSNENRRVRGSLGLNPGLTDSEPRRGVCLVSAVEKSPHTSFIELLDFCLLVKVRSTLSLVLPPFGRKREEKKREIKKSRELKKKRERDHKI